MPYSNLEKQKEANRKRQKRIREEFKAWKESNPCSDCGKFYPYYVMQLDHRSDKKFNVSQRSASFGSARFSEELNKCDLVCANCHSIRTHKSNGSSVR